MEYIALKFNGTSPLVTSPASNTSSTMSIPLPLWKLFGNYCLPANQQCFLGILSLPSLLSPAELSESPLIHPRLWQPGLYSPSCLCPGRCQHLVPGPLSISAFSSAVVPFIPLSLATPWTSSSPSLHHFRSHQVRPSSSSSSSALQPVCGHGLTWPADSFCT